MHLSTVIARNKIGGMKKTNAWKALLDSSGCFQLLSSPFLLASTFSLVWDSTTCGKSFGQNKKLKNLHPFSQLLSSKWYPYNNSSQCLTKTESQLSRWRSDYPMLKMVSLPNISNSLANIRCINTSSSRRILVIQQLKILKDHRLINEIAINHDLPTMSKLAVNLDFRQNIRTFLR